jgi:hypothetical protein
MEFRDDSSRDVVRADQPGKMSRLIACGTIRGSAEDLDRAMADLDAEVRN